MIRLTLLLTAGLIGTMLIFGTDDPSLQSTAIEQRVLPEPVKPVVREAVVTLNAPAVEPIAQPVRKEKPTPDRVVETVLEVTKLDSLDLSTIPPSNDLTEVVADDAAPEPELPEITPELTVEPSKLLFITGSRVNLRAGPSTGQAIVTQLGLGDRAELLTNTADGWVQIRHVDSGRIGYMSADFLSPAEPG